MSKSIYINDMRRDIDEGGGGGGATSADQVSYNGGTVKGALDTVRGDLNTFQFRMNEGSGEYKLESEGADSWRPFKGGATMELLWENPSPTAAFSAQTLNINSSNYKYVVVKLGYYNANLDKFFYSIYSKDPAYQSSDKVFITNPYAAYREFSKIEDTEIVFGDGGYYYGQSNQAANNGYGIPLAIYGI